MSVQVQFRRGNTSQHSVFTGAQGEITVDTDKNVVVVHDGVTAGGHQLAPNAAYDLANTAYSLIVSAAPAGNSYADQVGSASNAWANSVGTAGNNYTNAVGVAGNNYTDAVGLAGNNFAIQVGAAANNWANTKVDYVVGTAGEIFVTNSDDYNPTINLISTGVVAATYGSGTQIPTFVVDSLGRLTYAANISIEVMDYSYVNAIGVSANSYADSVGLAGNNYINAVGIAGNNYTDAVGLAGNNYTNAVGTAGNNYTDAVGLAGNNYTNSVGVAGNNYTNAVGVAGNNYTDAVGLSGNNYTISVGAAANNYANDTFFEKIGGDITGSVNVAGNFSVTGNLRVSGNTSFISVENYRVDDPLIYLAANNYTSDVVDIGFIANYVNTGGANVHTGLYREHVDKEWYLFQGYDKEPINNHIGALSNNMTLAVLNADLRTSNLNLGGANAILWITDAYDTANAKVASVTGTAGEIFSSGGTTPTLNLINTSVISSTYGGSTQIPVFTVDGQGRLTYAANVAVNGMDYPYANQIGAASNTWANTKLSNGTVTLAGALTTTGQITANAQINITPTGGSEGGEIQLQGSDNNTTWSLDAYQNNFRIFTTTGTTVSNLNFFHAGSGFVRMGVNRADPTYTLDVSGSANVSALFVNGSDISTIYATRASPTFTGTINMASANLTSQTLTDAASISWDISSGTIATVTLAGNRTLSNPTNLKVGTFILHVIQDGVGGRTLGYGSAFKWPAGVAPVLTTTAGARDVLSFVCDGTNLYGSFLPDVK